MEATRRNRRHHSPLSKVGYVGSPRVAWLAACCLAATAILLLLAPSSIQCEELLTVESRQAKEQAASENELADTLKYLEKLEKLDKYWSEVARPRFGRSEYKQPVQFAARSEQPLFRPQPMRLVRAMNAEPRIGSLVELLNARMAQRYNSNEAY